MKILYFRNLNQVKKKRKVKTKVKINIKRNQRRVKKKLRKMNGTDRNMKKQMESLA